MNTKLLLFILVGIFIIPNVIAVNITHVTTELIAPVNHTILYTINGTNETHLFPITCQGNGTLITSSGKCDVTRTLSFGETYVKDDSYCDISFTAPSCNQAAFENITHRIRWKLEGDADNLYITYMNEDKTRTYPRGEIFDYETEFIVQCPDAGDLEIGEDKKILNITDSQFLTYCIKPFGTYGENLNKLNSFWIDSSKEKDDTITSLSSSNTVLAGDLGSCEERENSFEELRSNYEVAKDELRTCSKDLTEAKEEISSQKLIVVLFWIQLILSIIVFMIWKMNQAVKDNLGDK